MGQKRKPKAEPNLTGDSVEPPQSFGLKGMSLASRNGCYNIISMLELMGGGVTKDLSKEVGKRSSKAQHQERVRAEEEEPLPQMRS